MTSFISGLSDQPILFFLGVILLSYLLEDAAIIISATLASQGSVTMALAFFAAFFGIVTGDIILYLLGFLARKNKSIYKFLFKKKSFKVIRKYISNNLIYYIIVARFIPGLRTVSYTLIGFLRLSFKKYLLAVTLGTSVWSIFVFYIVIILNNISLIKDNNLSWLIVVILIAISFIPNIYKKYRAH